MGEKKRKLGKSLTSGTSAREIPPTSLTNARVRQQQLRQSLASNPRNPAALFELSCHDHLLAVGNEEARQPVELIRAYLNEALDAITLAITLSPQEDAYWGHFAACLRLTSL